MTDEERSEKIAAYGRLITERQKLVLRRYAPDGEPLSAAELQRVAELEEQLDAIESELWPLNPALEQHVAAQEQLAADVTAAVEWAKNAMVDAEEDS